MDTNTSDDTDNEEVSRMEELYSYMDELNIDPDLIRMMKNEKITCTSITLMDEATLSRFIPRLGDRIALLDFAKRKTLLNKRKKGLVAKLKEMYKLKDTHKGLSNKESKKKKVKSYVLKNKERRVEIGWLHFKGNSYTQIRSSQGGGTRQISIKKNATKELFFANGNSQYGKLTEMECDLFDFQRTPFEDSIHVEDMFKTTGLSRLRYYLATKKKHSASATETSGAYEALLLNQSKEVENCFIDENNQSNQSKKLNTTFQRRHSKYVLSSSDDETREDTSTDPLTTMVGELLPDLSNNPQIEYTITDATVANSFSNEILIADEVVTTNDFGIQNLYSLDSPYEVSDPPETIDESMLRSSNVVTLHRGQVMKELIDFFSQEETHKKIKIQMLLPNGVEEAAEDGGGVFRDALSEFWHDFYECCTQGTKAKVPFIRHDYNSSKWKSVAHCLLKGWNEEKYFPIRLALPIIEYCFSGSTNCDMTEWFFMYISESEAAVLKSAIENYESTDQEELIEVLSNFECKKQPTKNNIGQLIKDISHKKLIQKPMYVINAWREVLGTNKLTETELKGIYNNLKPTPRNVLCKISCTPEDPEEAKVLGFLKKFIREAEEGILACFLRFCTGADLATTNSIAVIFNSQQGLSRAPSAHTCSGILELSKTYDSYPEFRNEFNNLLLSNIWVMDSI